MEYNFQQMERADFRTKNISCYGYSNSQIVNKFLDFFHVRDSEHTYVPLCTFVL